MHYPLEMPLEMAQRHVIEAEARVASQRARVAELASEGHDTTQAEAILATFEATLRFMRQDLADRQKQEGQPPQ